MHYQLLGLGYLTFCRSRNDHSRDHGEFLKYMCAFPDWTIGERGQRNGSTFLREYPLSFERPYSIHQPVQELLVPNNSVKNR